MPGIEAVVRLAVEPCFMPGVDSPGAMCIPGIEPVLRVAESCFMPGIDSPGAMCIPGIERVVRAAVEGCFMPGIDWPGAMCAGLWPSMWTR
jgi:hypothetical protein